MSFLSKALNPIARGLGNLNRQVGIRGAEPRKGNFQWMSGLPSKKVMKPIIINAHTLKQLSNTDPITWSIKAARKAQVTGTKWDIVPDVAGLTEELERWFQIIMANMNPWGFEEVFKPFLMSQDFYKKASEDVKNILRAVVVDESDKKKQVKWYFESLKRKLLQDALAHAQIVKRIFEKPNDSECRTFRTLLELLIDDILTYDAGVIVKNKNYIGELAELYILPGQDIKLYRNPDRTIPKPPEAAYVWEDMGILRAEFERDEIAYLMANPQQNGYGMSPLEVAAYVITASLYADEYNIDFFKHSNVPPGIFDMGKNITNEQRTAFEKLWDNEIQGKGLHRMMFLAGGENPKYIPIRTQSSRDMQMMEYLKWTLSIKCACFQISPQDISFVQDFHRSVAQVQKEITKERGIRNLLTLLETYFNTEIVKKEFPFRDVMFQWQDIDIADETQQSSIDIQDINAGVISRNDRRRRLGLSPVEGGDVILVTTPQGAFPIEQLLPSEQDSTSEQPIASSQADARLTRLEQTVAETPTTLTASEKPLTDEEKVQTVKMIVEASKQDKITKAMGELKKQGLGDSEVKIVLE